MPKFITSTEGVKINVNFIYEYGSENPEQSFVRNGYGKHVIDLPVDELDKIIDSNAGILSESDRNTISQLVRKLTEVEGAIRRMPTSFRVHY